MQQLSWDQEEGRHTIRSVEWKEEFWRFLPLLFSSLCFLLPFLLPCFILLFAYSFYVPFTLLSFSLSLHHVAYRILILWPRIKTAATPVRVRSPNNWTVSLEFPHTSLFFLPTSRLFSCGIFLNLFLLPFLTSIFCSLYFVIIFCSPCKTLSFFALLYLLPLCCSLFPDSLSPLPFLCGLFLLPLSASLFVSHHSVPFSFFLSYSQSLSLLPSLFSLSFSCLPFIDSVFSRPLITFSFHLLSCSPFLFPNLCPYPCSMCMLPIFNSQIFILLLTQDFLTLLLFSHSVVSDSLWTHGLQHARLPCPSPPPGACSNSCPWSQ